MPDSAAITPNQCGIIGIGLMGTAVQQMTRAGRGWDLDETRCTCAATAQEVFDNCEVVFLCLPNSDIAASTLRAASLRPGQIIIDTSTGVPEEMAGLGRELHERGLHYLDATVSGSSAQLLKKEVLVMVGGEAEVYERCRELLGSFARETMHVGPWGSGAQMKLVTNLVLGLNRAALAEGLAFAQQLDLDLTLTLDVMRRSMAYSRIMDTKGEKMIRQDFEPQAKLSQHLKDVRLMLQASSIPLPLSETHRQLLEKAVSLGFGEADNSAVIQALLKP
jgi:3-hydroxyisobutyrate dehydrogenase-like beta-hydroxyacid dehydrogenase